MLDQKILRSKDIAQKLNVSRSQAYNIMRLPDFTRIQLSVKNWGIYESDLQAYLTRLNGAG